MICRLCLITINVENRISIFTLTDNDDESQIVKLIAKFFHIEVTHQDSISTTLCRNCWNHIDEFHKFCIYVNEKQSTLLNEFLEVKCDVLLHADLVNASNEQNEESLCDIKDVLQEASQVQLKSEPYEVNIFEETGLSHVDIDVRLSDDDIPLQELIKRCSKKENLKKSTNVKPTRKINSAAKIKPAAKIKQATKKTIKKVTPSGKIKRLRSVLPVEDTHKVDFDSKDQDEVGLELETDIKNYKHTCEINQGDQPTTSADKKRKTKCPLKYPEISTEDKYTFISENMQMKCDLCNESFDKFCEVRSHFRAQHKCRAYIKCCDKRHSRLQDLFEHIKWHFDPEYFKCDICGKLLKNSVSLDVHKLNYHYKEEDLVYNCKYCDKRFPRPFLLNNHVKSTHESKRPFACQHCDKRFVLRNALATHIQSMHENIFPHICDICGMKFKFKPSFEKHVLEHQGIIEPRVQCPECGYWAKNKNCLRLHLNTHNKADVLCKYCGRVCASLSAMRAHIWHVHRRSLSNKCTFCEKSFKRPKSLKEHLATHTGISLYNCPHCTREFRSSSNMYVHIKHKHTQEWLAAQNGQTKTPPNLENN